MTQKHKVLLIEDDITLGDLLVYSFGKSEVPVTWFVRVRYGAEDGLIAMDEWGRESLLVPGDYTVALVDYRLKSSSLTGCQVTERLTQSGLNVIAASGLSMLNEELMQAGAVAGIEKQEIIGKLLKRDLAFLDV